MEEFKVTSVNQTMVFYGFAHRVMVKWSGVLEERTASIFIVAELFWLQNWYEKKFCRLGRTI
jgi:hypothetical protein